MNKCPITYLPCGEEEYSAEGLRYLAPGLSGLARLEYTAEEQRTEAFYRGSKMSVQGVQPKLSAILNIREGRFELVDRMGRYILKPQHEYFPELPENEDLTMRLASIVGLDVPVHGMVRAKDNSLTYFIKRFDRKGQKDKVPMEDFAQLAGLSRDTKYNYSMERLVKLIDTYCTFPALDKLKLFKMVLFSFLIGNEDMHLKNFSIINREGLIALSPCYDLLNSTIVLKKPAEEIALTLEGKKKKLSDDMLIDYFGREVCELTDKVLENVLKSINGARPDWLEEIEKSFLSPAMKDNYLDLLNTRTDRLFPA